MRRSVNGRPSGTDGSDFSYRMVVDSRYKKVAQGRSHLSAVIFTQAIIQFVAALVLFQTKPKGVTLDKLSISPAVIIFVSLVVGEIGRKRSRVNLLKLYLFGSSVATLISVGCLLKSRESLEIGKDQNSGDNHRPPPRAAAPLLARAYVRATSALDARRAALISRPEGDVVRNALRNQQAGDGQILRVKLVRWSEAGRCDLVRRCARWPIVLRKWMRDVAGRCKRSGETERALADELARLCATGRATFARLRRALSRPRAPLRRACFSMVIAGRPPLRRCSGEFPAMS
ncbi:protein jagunal1 [Dorcoceras hygrometricum]|uniref:Protein jagunal1 n=1 Tax=Dorcoceras hygrometricum TaxID=472368 RepID=A0A2Z7ATF3_9LAMI|nr:protein jagunal1 [Dorcoceras hygrometricum]